MTVPDAWDECGACGHDRDDHEMVTDYGPVPVGCTWPTCDCRSFTDETTA